MPILFLMKVGRDKPRKLLLSVNPCSRSSIGQPSADTQVRGNHVIASAERPIEMGQIPEPHIERYGADLLAGMEGIRQQPVRTGKALRQHVLGEGRAFALTVAGSAAA